jgi:glycosyltransferase involved in cell wall biosynthesis
MRYKEAKVVYNGVDRRLFHPAPIPHEGYVIGCVGNFTPGKRQIDLLEAFPDILKGMPDARLRFVGSGTELESCKRFVRENGLSDKVEFLSEVPHTEMPKFYNSLDVFVLPSVNEAFCCALIEAQACGLPIICCRGISTEEVMTEESKKNFLEDPYSPKAIAEAVLSVRHEQQSTCFKVDLDIDVLTRHFLDWMESIYWQDNRVGTS